jgi:VanZ family protein
MKKKILRIFLIILILAWMYMVFGFSAENGDASSGLSNKIARIFSKNDDVILILEPIIRKIAHLSEYALGGILFYSLFLTYRINSKKQVIFSILLGIIYAITDELHQLFVAGRSGKFQDVCIDSIGVMLGICLTLLIAKIVKLIKVKKQKL